MLLVSTPAFAGVNNITEQDGSPSTFPWKVKFANGTVTDNGDGTASVSGGSSSAGGNNADVQFNTAGAFDGEDSLMWDKSPNTISISRDVGQTGEAIRISSDTGAILATISHDGTAMVKSIQVGSSPTDSITIGGAKGLTITADNGGIKFLGIGNTNNEDLRLDLESVANQLTVRSGTGVSVMSIFSGALTLSSNGTDDSIVVSSSGSGVGTIYGINSSKTNTNTGASANASGIIGSGITSGNTANPTIARGVVGVALRSSTSGSTTGTIQGVFGRADYSSTGTQTDGMGVYGIVRKITSATGSITNAYSIYGDTPTASGGGTIKNSYGIATSGNLGFSSASGVSPDVVIARVGVGAISTDSSVISSNNNMGWSVVAAANQACTTTCTMACVFGEDSGTVGVLNSSIVDCANATADLCVCAGSS